MSRLGIIRFNFCQNALEGQLWGAVSFMLDISCDIRYVQKYKREEKLMNMRALTLGTIFFFVSIAAAQASNLVYNGDFDNIGNVWVNNTGLGSDDLQTSGATNIPGWTNVTGAVNEFWFYGPSNGYTLTASPGNGSVYAVDLTGQANNKPYGGIEQNIATTPGVKYMLTFDLGSSTEWNGPGNAAAALTASARGSVLDASQLFTLVPTGLNNWQSESLTFTADSSVTTIEFLADSDYTSQYTGLDNVSVSPQAATVPEPTTILLLGSSLFALVGFRRKIKK
jgi:hypothetical protein